MVKKEKKLDPDAKVRNKKDPVFPSTSSKVKDDKDHFPLGSEDQARNALARASQYSSVPDWYSGSLSSLVSAVARKVKSKYPNIEVSEAGKKPGKQGKSKKASNNVVLNKSLYEDIMRKQAQLAPPTGEISFGKSPVQKAREQARNPRQQRPMAFDPNKAAQSLLAILKGNGLDYLAKLYYLWRTAKTAGGKWGDAQKFWRSNYNSINYEKQQADKANVWPTASHKAKMEAIMKEVASQLQYGAQTVRASSTDDILKLAAEFEKKCSE